MPGPSELERVEHEKLDKRINPKEPIYITLRRGELQSVVMIDPLMFELSHDPVRLIAVPAAAFIKEMLSGR